jgi:hypothetical protein
MWLATKIGFYSIVEKEHHLHPNGDKLFVVRTRTYDDLFRLIATIQPKLKRNIQIHEYEKSDYPYRIYLETKEELSTTLATLASSITYPNFKDEISESDSQQEKSDAYSQLWLNLFMTYRPELFDERT